VADTEPVSYSIEVPTTAVTIWPPNKIAGATVTTPDPVPAPGAAFLDDSTVVFQVPSGGGNLKLGNQTRRGYTVPAGDERAIDLRGSTNRIWAHSTTGTVTVEVLGIP
jgi:hypothetical protein